jgi:outer membrane protein assembly factor BamD (BamD/ComL family)
LQASSSPAIAPSVAAFIDDNEVVDAPKGHASQLKEEANVLRQARAQLHAGAFASALALLDSSQRRFAAPELYQERESLMIELLFRTGQTAAASQRAKQFLATFPESPHADRVRTFSAP